MALAIQQKGSSFAAIMTLKKAALLILDGWGIGPKPSADAIEQANTPFFDQLMANNPHSTLITYGEDVGLPEGQMGNSEVGHLNIGAGRVVWQELARINKAVREQELDQNQVLLDAINYAKTEGKSIHLVGLVSDGGVHSHIEHLKALVRIIETEGHEQTFIHAFTDGRDCDPRSGAGFMDDLQDFLKGRSTRIGSLVGRYYGMDRDKRWERVKWAYDLMVHNRVQPDSPALVTDFAAYLRDGYAAGITDEFALPAAGTTGEGRIQSGDVVLCFNFRTDRCREITEVLSQRDMPEFEMSTLPLYYVTMTKYDDTFRDVKVMFEKDDVSLTIGEVLEQAGKTQVRIAETEKYPHVTFFMSGGREQPFTGERRLMVPSPKVATYDLQPEMSALEITERIMADIRTNGPDWICLNFANADMVGHTGVFSAAIKAAEAVDECLAQLVPLALEHGYQLLIIADHGNSDYMINEDGSPNTAHTKNPVPCLLVGAPEGTRIRAGRLADVAPTLLDLMGVAQPEVMSGVSLLS
jgi:2,3-bisphosphoglycerate-independent phosphoglycerate mutase